MRPIYAFVALLLLSGVCSAQTPEQMPTPAPTPRQLTWWDKLLLVSGVSATPRNQRGEESARTGDFLGDIYVVALNSNFEPTGAGSKITTGGGFRSPVFLPGGDDLLAIKGEKIVRLSVSRRTEKELQTVKGIVKLVGVNAGNPDEVLILTDLDRDNCPGVGMFSLSTGKVTPIPYGLTGLDETRVRHLMGGDREYDDVRLQEVPEADARLNVYVKPSNRDRVNVSGCAGVNCFHPTYINNPRRVAYVKQE